MPDNDSQHSNPSLEPDPNITSILFRCYGGRYSAAQAADECARFSFKDVNPEQIQLAYDDFRRLADKLTNMFFAYITNIKESLESK